MQELINYVGSLQVGGGINSENSSSYIEKGASHVIVTSVSYYLLSIYGFTWCMARCYGSSRLDLG